MELDRLHNVLEIPVFVARVLDKQAVPSKEERETLTILTSEISRMVGKNINLNHIPQILAASLHIKDRYGASESKSSTNRIPFHKILASLLKAQIDVASVIDLTMYDIYEITYFMSDKSSESQQSLNDRIAAFEKNEKEQSSQ